MQPAKSTIIAQLQKDILSIQGHRPLTTGLPADPGLGPIMQSFPDEVFPWGAVHEFITTRLEDRAATAGFLTGLLAALLRSNGVAIWISASRTLFPPALKFYGIDPDRILFVDLQNEKKTAWAMEETLKCGALTAVVGELSELGFTESRRLQLAVEQSRVTGFLLRHRPRQLATTACVTRWQISSLPSEPVGELPGIGFPKWQIDLLKVRNGKPGSWQMKWEEGRFVPIYPESLSLHPSQIKIA